MPSPAYVLLIGIDGFRHDYAERYGAPNILALKQLGSGTNHLVPRFPSSTFPNFYSMATGLEPQDHGIVGMHFYDPPTGREFDFRRDGRDGSWYGGTPIWIAAEEHGLRTASYFWVGTDAAIRNQRPSYYHEYDSTITHQQRVEQVIAWFNLPESERPRLVTLYFADVDTAGHLFGPESEHVRESVLAVDATLGVLFRELERITPSVDVVVVSDHGMIAVERVIQLGTGSDLHGFRIANEGSHVMFYSVDGRGPEEAYRTVQRDTTEYSVYRREDVPPHLCFANNPRIGDVLVIANGPYILHARDAGVAEDEGLPGEWPKGWHGYDPTSMPEMHGIFYAIGPHLKPGITIDTLPNIHVHSLLAHLLGVPGTNLRPSMRSLLR